MKKIATGLAVFHDTGKYPDFLGHYGQFENNTKAMESQLNKIHIALYRSDWSLKTWQRDKGYNRASDNFVVYVRHFFFDDYYQILGIVTPKAHQRIDQLLPTFIDMAEIFHSTTNLSQLIIYQNNHEITQSFKLTTHNQHSK